MKKVIFLSLIFTLSIFGDYSNHIDSKIVIDELVSKHGFDESYVIEVLKNAEKRDEMLQSVAKPAEKTKTWDEYKAIFIKTKRIRDGKKFISKNITTLEKAEKEFGVPKEIITAILGVETNYGSNKGGSSLLSFYIAFGIIISMATHKKLMQR